MPPNVSGDWHRAVGPLVFVRDNFKTAQGHTVAQPGREWLTRRWEAAIESWDYGDEEEAQADLYLMMTYR